MMTTKRFLTLGLLTCAALTAASVAVASKGGVAKSQAASATFSATTVSNSTHTTCNAKGSDKYVTTKATYAGTATSSDARLNGKLVIKAKSVVDQTNGLGSVVGTFQITGTKGASTVGRLRAAISNNQLAGLASGLATKPAGHLLASLAGAFGATSGFTTGSLGTGPTTGAGAIRSGISCGG